jgi:hypothetical protein
MAVRIMSTICIFYLTHHVAVHITHPATLMRGASRGDPARRARLWRPRRRLAAAPGRFARPAPPGNDDPCGERRTIPEGMPRRRQGIGGRLTTASTGPGQKSHVERRKASVPSLGTQDASHRTSGLPDARKAQAGWLPGLRKSIAARARPWCAMNARRGFARACADR